MESSHIKRFTGRDLIHGDEARVLSREECPGQACRHGGSVRRHEADLAQGGRTCRGAARRSKGPAGSGLVVAYRLKMKTSV